MVSGIYVKIKSTQIKCVLQYSDEAEFLLVFFLQIQYKSKIRNLMCIIQSRLINTRKAPKHIKNQKTNYTTCGHRKYIEVIPVRSTDPASRPGLRCRGSKSCGASSSRPGLRCRGSTSCGASSSENSTDSSSLRTS